MNTHVTIESGATERRHKLTSRERGLAGSTQDAELFLFGAADAGSLTAQMDRVLAFAARLSRSELIDVAAELERNLVESGIRAAVIASSPAELAGRLAALKSRLDQGATSDLDFDQGFFLGDSTAAPRIGFLFPGQGSPAHLDGGMLRRRFDFVRELYDEANLPAGSDGVSTEVAQPAIITASLAGLRVLNRLDQAVGITAPTKARHHPSQGSQEHLTVLVVTKDSLPRVAARGDVIEGTREFNTQWASHRLSCTKPVSYCKM